MPDASVGLWLCRDKESINKVLLLSFHSFLSSFLQEHRPVAWHHDDEASCKSARGPT